MEEKKVLGKDASFSLAREKQVSTTVNRPSTRASTYTRYKKLVKQTGEEERKLNKQVNKEVTVYHTCCDDKHARHSGHGG